MRPSSDVEPASSARTQRIERERTGCAAKSRCPRRARHQPAKPQAQGAMMADLSAASGVRALAGCE